MYHGDALSLVIKGQVRAWDRMGGDQRQMSIYVGMYAGKCRQKHGARN